MRYKTVNINSALNKITKKDILFNGDYTIDPYQNCEFGCAYCDSAMEKKVFIKNNITDVFEKEIKKIKDARIIIGSVHDPYQKIESTGEKTREILKLIKKHNLCCHILTKSNLVLRDIELLKEIKDCNITISISTIDCKKKELFEKNVISTEDRLKIVKKLNKENIKSGISLIPIIPYVTDFEIEEIIKKSKENNSSYFLYKYLELKGDQKILFLDIIKNSYSEIYDKFKELYVESFYPKEYYSKKMNSKINKLLEKYKLKNKIKN